MAKRVGAKCTQGQEIGGNGTELQNEDSSLVQRRVSQGGVSASRAWMGQSRAAFAQEIRVRPSPACVQQESPRNPGGLERSSWGASGLGFHIFALKMVETYL